MHGPAAAGKLTVARELSHTTGFRLLHHHLTVAAVTAVFDFGSEPFVLLREQIWRSSFREAAQRNVALIFTFAPERAVRPSCTQDTLDAVESAGGKVRFGKLTCPIEERERRGVNAARAGFGTRQSLELFRALNEPGVFESPELPDAGLSIDTSQTSPREAAVRICELFSLETKVR